jgi:DNA-directed RNA polymerase subunit RPC12/RpoP
MNSTFIDKNTKLSLDATLRCDKCSARALVLVKGRTGELMFCAHHYNKIMDNAVGYDKMMKFAVEILDKRYALETKEDLEEAIKR